MTPGSRVPFEITMRRVPSGSTTLMRWTSSSSKVVFLGLGEANPVRTVIAKTAVSTPEYTTRNRWLRSAIWISFQRNGTRDLKDSKDSRDKSLPALLSLTYVRFLGFRRAGSQEPA